MSNPTTDSQHNAPHAEEAAPVGQPSQIKRAYTPPELTHYGSVTEMTQKNPLDFLQDEILAETSP
jgi:hypothetical protein